MSLDFLYTGVSWVLLRWYQLFTLLGLSEGSGLDWFLSIVFLVITARLALFRFFLKQVHYQRNMQAMQPRLRAIRESHKDDRQALQREMLRLQQEEGFNPLAGCLPMLLQIPIFISLFHVLRHVSNSASLCHPIQVQNATLSLYGFTATQTCSAADAKLFGAPLAGSLTDSRHTIESTFGGSYTSTLIVTIIVVIISAAATLHPAAGQGRQSDPARGHRGHRAEADGGRHPDLRTGLRPVLPARCAHLLVHQQRLDHGPTALHQQIPPAPPTARRGRRHRRRGSHQPQRRSPHNTRPHHRTTRAAAGPAA